MPAALSHTSLTLHASAGSLARTLGHAIRTAAVSADLNSRRQLTLFVAEPWRTRLDALRQTLDPTQASLIAAHVTLCREDEIEQLDAFSIFNRAGSWEQGPINLVFGRPQRFGDHGVLLPCEQGSSQFQRLRRHLLGDQDARQHGAHLTIAHPRNPRATGNTDSALALCPEALELQFAAVTLIEQQGTAPWRVLQESTLGSYAHGVA